MTRNPEWLDHEEYPFESHYADVAPGRLHYVDEGVGQPIVLLHGNPTWSFLYRHLIQGLSDEYRCVAPDYLGFGLSEKPRDFSYRPADHARIIEGLIDELDLEDITLVVQDWGGPIGMNYAVEHPDNVHSLVVMNTWMWPVSDSTLRLFSSVLGSRFGKSLITRYNFFARVMMPRSYSDRSKLTPAIHRHYTAPLAAPGDRVGSWVFPREITTSHDWLARLWERRGAVADTPALLCWGMADPGFGDKLRPWQALFPDARTLPFEDAGHYLQEEKGREMVPELRQFLEQS